MALLWLTTAAATGGLVDLDVDHRERDLLYGRDHGAGVGVEEGSVGSDGGYALCRLMRQVVR